ncbi:protein AKNAD1 [Pyxicephalus adspersus]|uniref:protein AKNAD1 n=1 Tax=Pyxicephalus adspersus TaxID=30357 RepID=UPI003B5ACC6B
MYLSFAEDDLETCKAATTVHKQSQNIQDEQFLTEGEKMSRIVMEQVQQLKHKVESFSDCIFVKSLSAKEEFLVFQNLRSCLESLELNYLSTKDRHRSLQLQTYRTGCQTVGEFDLEREVEGQIYRLGMLLEDIQEQINKSEESVTESPPSIKPQKASVPSHDEEPGDTTFVENSFTERVLSNQEEGPISSFPDSW